MKIKVYVVDLEVPPPVKRWALKLGIPAALLLAGGTLAYATSLPVTWSTGQTLTAADLNSNFKAVTVLTTDAGVSYSVGATMYCGTGPTSTTGAINYNSASGYLGAKATCQQSSGCGTSPTAHMCSTEEIVRSAQAGISMPAGWYSSGDSSTTDCLGWGYADQGGGTATGPSWSPLVVGSNPAHPSDALCSTSQPILCCD